MHLKALHDNQPYFHFGCLSLKNKLQKEGGSVGLLCVNKLEPGVLTAVKWPQNEAQTPAAGSSALICSFFEPGCNRFLIVPRLHCCWLKLPSLPFLPQLRLPLISFLLSCLCLLELSLFLLIRSLSINDVDPGRAPEGFTL